MRSTRPHGPVDSDLNDERWEETGVHPTLTPNATTQNVLVSSESPSQKTYAVSETWALRERKRQEGRNLEMQPELSYALEAKNDRWGGPDTLIFSQAGARARTCQSPDNAADSTKANAPTSSSRWPASSTLFDPDGFSGRTFQVRSLHKAVGTSEQSLERWPTSGMAWAGGFSTAVSSECRSDAEGCSSSEPSLTEILEPPQNVPAKYLLSGRAARGILRRAEKRGRTLPSHLSAALEQVAQTTTTDRPAA